MMKRRVKLLLLLVALALSLVALVGGSGYTLVRGTPDFYKRPVLSAEQLAAVAESAEQKIAEARNWLAKTHALESARVAGKKPATGATTGPGGVTITFSEGELNAFFDKWAETAGWRDAYMKYLTNPVLVLRDGNVIVAGTVKDYDAVVSVHFRPQLVESTGELRLDLARVQVGRLPVPESMFASYKTKLENALRTRLPAWQADARIRDNGAANAPAVMSAIGKMALGALQHRPVDSAVFLPLQAEKFIPVRVTGLSVDKDRVTMTATPLDAGERTALLHKIREPYNPPRLASAGGGTGGG